MSKLCKDCMHSLYDAEPDEYLCFNETFKQISHVTGEVKPPIECDLQRKYEGSCRECGVGYVKGYPLFSYGEIPGYLQRYWESYFEEV